MAAAKSNAKVKTRAKSVRRAAPSKQRRVAPAKRRRPAPKAAPKARRPQAFVVSHLHEDDFETGGLRRYAKYRDLGIAAATSGLARAHVIRFVPPFRADVVAIPHYHDVDFQLIYVLKGWLRSEFEGHGTITMRQGSCWIQPPRTRHTLVGYSDDCEVLEVILPADFKTVELGKPT
ncbi:MAG: cupin domain-containing protein [Rhizobiales bacterium]|nr:cupin domain-containing protein [Hyphomicrobiales bacterium]